jgi:polar amino acid transport system substrate-binding protein
MITRCARLVWLCSGVFLISIVTSQKLYAQQTIPVWTYFSSPPYITAYQQGLNYDFIELLNRFAKGQYQFELEPVTRARIKRNLQENISGTVLFAERDWVGDSGETRYLWSLPILHDRNEIVSRRHGKPPIKIYFNGARSLEGMVFGGLSGRHYEGLEHAFREGDIVRKNVEDEEQNLAMLMRGHIDVMSSVGSVVHYKIKVTGLENSVYFSPRPHSRYTRHVLITPDLKNIEVLVNEFILGLEQNVEWRSIKKKYVLE